MFELTLLSAGHHLVDFHQQVYRIWRSCVENVAISVATAVARNALKVRLKCECVVVYRFACCVCNLRGQKM
jgi:hypothetical protein